MLDQVLQILINQWMYDIDMFAHLLTTWYHYLWLGPLIYIMFFFTKWIILTAPLWLPVWMVVEVIGSAFSRR